MNDEIEEDPSEEYIRAYNDDYQMARYEPELLDEILKSYDKKLSNNYFIGLEQGRSKYLHEQRVAEMEERQTLSKKRNRRIK